MFLKKITTPENRTLFFLYDNSKASLLSDDQGKVYNTTFDHEGDIKVLKDKLFEAKPMKGTKITLSKSISQRIARKATPLMKKIIGLKNHEQIVPILLNNDHFRDKVDTRLVKISNMSSAKTYHKWKVLNIPGLNPIGIESSDDDETESVVKKTKFEKEQQEENEGFKQLMSLFEELNEKWDDEKAETILGIIHEAILGMEDAGIDIEVGIKDVFKGVASGSEGIVFFAPPDKRGKIKYVFKLSETEFSSINDYEKWKDWKGYEIFTNNRAHKLGLAPKIHFYDTYKVLNEEKEITRLYSYYIMDYVKGSTLLKFDPEKAYYGEDTEKIFVEKQSDLYSVRLRDTWKKVYDQFIENLSKLHDNELLHGDLNPGNIIVQSQQYGPIEIQFIDFTATRFVSDNQAVWGSQSYMSILKNENPDEIETLLNKVIKPIIDVSSTFNYMYDDYTSINSQFFTGYTYFEEYYTSDPKGKRRQRNVDNEYFLRRDIAWFVYLLRYIYQKRVSMEGLDISNKTKLAFHKAKSMMILFGFLNDRMVKVYEKKGSPFSTQYGDTIECPIGSYIKQISEIKTDINLMYVYHESLTKYFERVLFFDGEYHLKDLMFLMTDLTRLVNY